MSRLVWIFTKSTMVCSESILSKTSSDRPMIILNKTWNFRPINQTIQHFLDFGNIFFNFETFRLIDRNNLKVQTPIAINQFLNYLSITLTLYQHISIYFFKKWKKRIRLSKVMPFKIIFQENVGSWLFFEDLVSQMKTKYKLS